MDFGLYWITHPFRSYWVFGHFGRSVDTNIVKCIILMYVFCICSKSLCQKLFFGLRVLMCVYYFFIIWNWNGNECITRSISTKYMRLFNNAFLKVNMKCVYHLFACIFSYFKWCMPAIRIACSRTFLSAEMKNRKTYFHILFVNACVSSE